ncbi:type II secretion system protein [Shewanella sp.]|uniref:type II secretion system protein n=1 Tax=Shewanella sp. TaxID=50422 RepID=UPI001ED4023D|nr:type II secretion system protein [Shewanella sp.]NRB24937.1 type II secretion system protein [Shewanella sp.]
MKKDAGYTLVELVVMVIIQAMLATIALPKFINIKQDAPSVSTSKAVVSVSTSKAVVSVSTSKDIAQRDEAYRRSQLKQILHKST